MLYGARRRLPFSLSLTSFIMLIRIFSFLIGATALSAATFSIEGAVDRALRSNPDLAAARWTIEEARGRLLQSGRRTNPELEVELKPNVRGRGEFTFSAGFMQKYPVTNRLWLERAISEAELRAAGAEVANAERLLAADVRTAAVKILALKAQRTLKETQRRNSLELAEAAAKTAQTGEGSALEASQFDLEARQLSLEVLQVDAEIAAQTGTLRPLLGVPAAQNVSVSGDLTPPVAAAGGVSPANRPDYRAATEKENAARIAVEAAQKGKWEDAGFGMVAEIERANDAPDGRGTDGFIGFKFSLPLPFWNRNEGKVHEAAATAAKAVKQREALALNIRSEAGAALAEMEAAAKIVNEASGPLLTKARELEESFRKAKEAGQATAAEVLRAREKRLALEAARLSALRDYHLARVRLLSAQGR